MSAERPCGCEAPGAPPSKTCGDPYHAMYVQMWRSRSGCWAAYGNDWGPYLISVHPTEVEALRAAVDGFGHAVFLPWGMRLADAIEADR